jgi:flagellar basal-body rod protein FlgB
MGALMQCPPRGETMRIDNMFAQPKILGAAMQGTLDRGAVIINNIANVDTPGFKRSELTFEESLSRAVRDFRNTGRVDLSKVTSNTFKPYEHFSVRWDENNVDIEVEMAQLYQNNMRYNVMSTGIMNHYRIINMVIGMV